MTSYKKGNKSASMDGFESAYQSRLWLSRNMERKRKYPHVKYVKAELSYYQRRQTNAIRTKPTPNTSL